MDSAVIQYMHPAAWISASFVSFKALLQQDKPFTLSHGQRRPGVIGSNLLMG
jgi:hypothetical protein